MADEQRDLISNRGSSMLNVGGTQRSVLGRSAALSTLSILVALLIAGQAVTIYFVYQQSGQISKLTKTSQTLQLEALQRKLPASAKPVNQMKTAMMNSPMVMRVWPLASSVANTAVAPASNRTEDQVKHLLLQADPRKMFPELKDSLMDNLKRLKSTMTFEDWQSFESWMHKWLLFEMAKNPKPEEEHKEIPAKKVAASQPARTALQHGDGASPSSEDSKHPPEEVPPLLKHSWDQNSLLSPALGSVGSLLVPAVTIPSLPCVVSHLVPL
ncbi:HLA class II histocompatibility antigen gamma chain isoform X2 [Pezoporus wallicus]|uniref:HLA class II histocompatibility antigen gamma chain isoform X2 n=1 Tax=Pezoporus wallicus TaxID=35540 RepID=UPI00254F0659|nr:HLA class II histocompatibility antigen gamma chain isoform X2 [Pezoporus wallicus]